MLKNTSLETIKILTFEITSINFKKGDSWKKSNDYNSMSHVLQIRWYNGKAHLPQGKADWGSNPGSDTRKVALGQFLISLTQLRIL